MGDELKKVRVKYLEEDGHEQTWYSWLFHVYETAAVRSMLVKLVGLDSEVQIFMDVYSADRVFMACQDCGMWHPQDEYVLSENLDFATCPTCGNKDDPENYIWSE